MADLVSYFVAGYAKWRHGRRHFDYSRDSFDPSRRSDVSGPPDIAIAQIATDIPDLPVGMMVDGVLLFAVLLGSPATPRSIVSISIGSDHDGYGETGEWLESIAFETESGIIQVAARDAEWLAPTITAEWAHYAKRGFTQVIHEAPAGAVLHFSVAWRTTSPGDGERCFQLVCG